MNFWEFLHHKTKDWGSDDFVFFFVFAAIPLVAVLGMIVCGIIYGIK